MGMTLKGMPGFGLGSSHCVQDKCGVQGFQRGSRLERGHVVVETRWVDGGKQMYAVFIEVNANESHIEQARGYLQEQVAPATRESGAKAGYWLAPVGGRGVSVVVYDTEEDAKQVAAMFEIGKPPGPDAPADVTVRTVEVREVLAAL